MIQDMTRTTGRFSNIVHPTDLGEAGRAAFAHGLRLAVAARGRFAVVHNAGRELDDAAALEAFPGVRDTLASWGLLDLGAPTRSVEEVLGIRVSKADLGGGGTVETLVDYIDRHGCDLVVLATHARDGLPRWLRGSVAAAIARRAAVPTLFLPHDARGFVEPRTGALRLADILMPIDSKPDPAPAIAAVTRLVEMLDAQAARLHLLHVGPAATAPEPAVAGWLAQRLERHHREGPVVDAITAEADATDADLVVMTTEGRHGFLDALRGSTTEAVLRRANRPLLAVPA
jgi:nucleotide-binding universal stress UspA family protein